MTTTLKDNNDSTWFKPTETHSGALSNEWPTLVVICHKGDDVINVLCKEVCALVLKHWGELNKLTKSE